MKHIAFRCGTSSKLCTLRVIFKIGTIRNLIPKSVNVMALTATATSHTVSVVTTHLAMDEPLVVGLNADRSNVKYVVKPNQTIDELSTTLASELIVAQPSMPRTVIFCRTLHECADVYTAFKQKLGPNITKPPGLPNILQLRITTLFTGASTSELRKEI